MYWWLGWDMLWPLKRLQGGGREGGGGAGRTMNEAFFSSSEMRFFEGV